ncbi:hypothetical protein QL285_092124 [Trifolium repens]|nr:hypothetical protein QL285_092119 [Trifolium repens]KAK2354628.1 hypothetical protein QL285_092124 [Trifolium repens]
MDFNTSIIALVLVFLVCPTYSFEISSHHVTNQTFRSREELQKLKKTIATRLRQINKPGVKTFQTLNGDIIDCIPINKQLAFDHPLLKGQKPLDPPERPRAHNQTDSLNDNSQLWNLSNETCPEKTVPIKRTTKEDILRSYYINRFGKKLNSVKRNTIGIGHVYATASVTGVFCGAKTYLNVWKPQVANKNELSLAQIWVTCGPIESINTIEAGWQVNPSFYGDYLPRLFIYWTADGYKRTGCYNYRCSGFVQTSNKVIIGSSLTPISAYNGQQTEIALNIWKAPSGDWNMQVVTPTSDRMSIPLSNPMYLVEQPNCYSIQEGINNQWGNYFYYGGPGRNQKCP